MLHLQSSTPAEDGWPQLSGSRSQSPGLLFRWHAVLTCIPQYAFSRHSLLHICIDVLCPLCLACKLYLVQEYFALGGSLGSGRAVAAFRGLVAVGTSNGVVGVLMPRGLSADGHPNGQARVVQLGEARPEDNAVSSMAFSLQASHHQHTLCTLLMLSYRCPVIFLFQQDLV